MFTRTPYASITVEDMRIPFTVLGGLVLYFVWASSFADVTRGVVESIQP